MYSTFPPILVNFAARLSEVFMCFFSIFFHLIVFCFLYFGFALQQTKEYP